MVQSDTRWSKYLSKGVELSLDPNLDPAAQGGYATASVPNTTLLFISHEQVGPKELAGTTELVRPVPLHYESDLGSKEFGDDVGAVGGRLRAEHCELLFSHRHTLLTPNRTTPAYNSHCAS